jgi:hypothetical protein
VGWMIDDATVRMNARREQAEHARLAAQARAVARTAGPHRMSRVKVRGFWFPGRPVNAVA